MWFFSVSESGNLKEVYFGSMGEKSGKELRLFNARVRAGMPGGELCPRPKVGEKSPSERDERPHHP